MTDRTIITIARGVCIFVLLALVFIGLGAELGLSPFNKISDGFRDHLDKIIIGVGVAGLLLVKGVKPPRSREIYNYICRVQYYQRFSDDFKESLSKEEKVILANYENSIMHCNEIEVWRALRETDKELIAELKAVERISGRLLDGEIFLKQVEGGNVLEGPLCYKFPESPALMYMSVKLGDLSRDRSKLKFTIDQPRRPIAIDGEYYMLRSYIYTISLERKSDNRNIYEGVLEHPYRKLNGLPCKCAYVKLIDNN